MKFDWLTNTFILLKLCDLKRGIFFSNC